MSDRSLADAAGRLRHFNRFYTRQIGVLDRGLYGSGRSLADARLLYELAQGADATAGDLARRLAMDPGFLSRMLTRLEREGLVVRRRSQADGRVSHLAVTPAGQAAFAELDGLSQHAAEAMISPLADEQRSALLTALGRVEGLLAADLPRGAVVLRPHRVGDMGWIVHRQALLYAHEYGWDIGYEALIAEIVAKFARDFDAACEHCWVAEQAGEIVGSVFLVRGDESGVAKLRLLYVEKAVRGAGVGRRLIGECVAFAREKGYARLDLWTQSVLEAATRLYRETGFRLIREEPHHSFGHDLIGQFWSLDLQTGEGELIPS
jgi:DNA-binding MarR family transcriptional regulator/N-acetylglutamate synthase-like GNAT family acetyltransferase